MDFVLDYHYATKIDATDNYVAEKILDDNIIGRRFTLKAYGDVRFYLHKSKTYRLWYIYKVISGDFFHEFGEAMAVIEFLNSNMMTITDKRFD